MFGRQRDDDLNRRLVIMRTVTWVRMFVAAVLVGTVVVSCS